MKRPINTYLAYLTGLCSIAFCRIMLVLSTIILFSIPVPAEANAAMTILVSLALDRKVDPNLSTVTVYRSSSSSSSRRIANIRPYTNLSTPQYLYICPTGQSIGTVTVIPKDSEGQILGKGQNVQIFTTAGRLLDQVLDHSDGTYTQSLIPGGKVETAIITVVVNNVLLSQQPNVYFVNHNPQKICLVAGNEQRGSVSTPLVRPMVVKVVGSAGLPVYGAPVIFSVKEGGGSIIGQQPVITNRKGLAEASLILGPEPGRNVAMAFLDDVNGSPVTFLATAEERLIKAVWLYHLEGMDKKDQEEVLSHLTKAGVNRIYLDLEASDAFLPDTPEGEAMLADFVAMAHDSDIQVEGMILQDPNWIDLFNPWPGGLRSDEVIHRANMVIYSPIPFAGLHINVSPYKHPQWSFYDWKTNNELMLRFQVLLGLIKDAIRISERDISFSATVAWWYNNAADLGLLPEGDALLLSNSLEYMVPTVIIDTNTFSDYYFFTPGTITDRRSLIYSHLYGHKVYFCVIDELKKLEGTGKKIIVGLLKETETKEEEPKVLSLQEYLNQILYPYDSFTGSSIGWFYWNDSNQLSPQSESP